MVTTRSLAVRILIERGRAVGVEYRTGRRLRTARAAREVILCGGAINTPQLLMLSGIGDPDHLREVGIAPAMPLRAVGRNLQDHYATGLLHERREPGPFVHATRADRLAVAFARAYLAGTGPATDVPSGFMAFIKTDPGLDIPDIQLLFRSGSRAAGPWFPGIRKPWQDAFVCRPILLRPASRGRIRLRSAKPEDRVRIGQNFLAEEADVKTLRAGLRLLREVAAQAALDRFRGRELAPGPEVRSDAAARRLYPLRTRHRASSLRYLPHGSGCGSGGRSRAQAARGRGIAGRRCFGHARPRRRQYQRHRHHDRGKGGGLIAGGPAPRAADRAFATAK